jgi:hypothetical protein
MHCNIDARGKVVRLVAGFVTLLTGGVLLFAWALGSGQALPWLVTAACALAGAFMVFEARNGWCALRALGFRTPL